MGAIGEKMAPVTKPRLSTLHTLSVSITNQIKRRVTGSQYKKHVQIGKKVK